MTHYAVTQNQQEALMPPEGESGESGGIAAMEGNEAEHKLLEALQSTPNDTSDTRVKTAILSGLLVPELLPSRMEQEQARRDGQEDDQRRQQEQGSQSERYEDESEDDYQLRLQQEEEQRRQQDERR